MITFETVNSAQRKWWTTVSVEYQDLADQALKAAKDLRDNGSKPLSEDWTDEVGKSAAKKFEKLANQFECAYNILLSINMVADGMATTVDLAMTTLREAGDLARRYGMTIDDKDGTVTGPEVRNRNEAEEWGVYRAQVQGLVDQAVEQVKKADKLAAAELRKLGKQTKLTDPAEALDEFQTHASHVQMRMLAADIPVNEDPATVRKWWDGLTEKQRKDMMLAQPTVIANLDGIPADVKKDIRGNGKYDRAKMVQYALDNWNKGDPTDFGSNCTNFVSNALSAAGMQEKREFGPPDSEDKDQWFQAKDRWGWDALDRRDYSHTWAVAEDQQNFMLEHGGQEVAQSQVEPGDIIYFEQKGAGASHETGNTWHAAIVTGVMPDGEIKYTQHTDSRQNVSLEGRTESTEKNEGDQNLRFVRPDPDWY